MGTYSRISQEIQETLAAFTACTALPISALTLEGAVLGYAGSKLPGALDVDKLKAAYEKVALRLESCELTPWPIHLNLDGDSQFQLTAVPITEGNHSPGIYLIGPFSRSQLHACVHFLVGLLRQIQASKISSPGGFPANLHVRRAVRYVHQHYKEPLTLASMARHLGITKSYLAQVFRGEMGETFSEFVNRFRVEMSKEALAHGSEPVLTIALRHGFTSQNYYGRVFKKLTGITPSEFRNQARFQSVSQGELPSANSQ